MFDQKEIQALIYFVWQITYFHKHLDHITDRRQAGELEEHSVTGDQPVKPKKKKQGGIRSFIAPYTRAKDTLPTYRDPKAKHHKAHMNTVYEGMITKKDRNRLDPRIQVLPGPTWLKTFTDKFDLPQLIKDRLKEIPEESDEETDLGGPSGDDGHAGGGCGSDVEEGTRET